MDIESQGIFQADLIIRTALIAAIQDLRVNTWLLPYAFASLLWDDLTKSEYGQREVDNAIKWFLSTKIPVIMSTHVDEPLLPCVSISLLESAEAETTLGDVHWQPTILDTTTWPDLSAPFTPPSYDIKTGDLVLPSSVTDSLVPTVGQQILTKDGKLYPILAVPDEWQTVQVAPGTVADWNGAIIKGAQPGEMVQMESVKARESYTVGCHVQGEQIHLTYLHSLILFCLYRYKQSLLESRGFGRAIISNMDFRENPSFGSELVWSRHIKLSGYVTQTWPKEKAAPIQAVDLNVVVDSNLEADAPDEMWSTDLDT